MAQIFEVGIRIAGQASGAVAALTSVKHSLNAVGSTIAELRSKQTALSSSIQHQMGSVAPRALASLHQQYLSIGRTIDQLQAKQMRLASLQAQGVALRDARSELRGQAVGSIGTALAVAAPLGQAVRQAAGFQDQMRDTAITGDFSSAEEARLSKAVRESAVQWNQTQTEVAKGIGVLVAGGIQDAKELERFAPQMARVATATRASMDDLGSVATALRDNLNITATGFESSMNMLAYAGKRGQFEIRDMAKWLPALTPMFGTMGVAGKEAVAEIGAALQIARKGAGSNDEAANNFKNFLTKLFAQDTKKDFEKAGIDIEESLKRLRAQGLTPVQAMLDVVTDYMQAKGPGAAKAFTQAMETKDEKERAMAVQRVAEAYKLGELFQDMQAMSFIRPAISNMWEMKDIKKGSLEAADKDLIGTDYKRRTETALEQFKALKIGLTELGISVSSILLPPLVSALNTISPVVRSFAEWAQQHPVWVKGLVGISAGLVTAKLAFIGIKYAALGAALQINTLSKGVTLASIGWTRLQAMQQMGGFAAASGRMGAIGSSMAAGFKSALPWIGRAAMTLLRLTPVGLALSAVGLVVYKYWQPIKGFFVGLWQGLSSVAGPAIKGLIGSVKSFGASIGRLVLSIPGIGFALKLVQGFAAPVFTTIAAGVRNVWNWFKNLLKPVDDVGGKAQSMGLRVGQALGGIVKGITTLPSKFLRLGGDLVDGLVNGIQAKLGEAVKAIGQLGEAVAGKFKSALGIHSPSRVFMGFGDNVAQGAAIGISRSTSQASQAATGMAKETLSAASTAGSQAAARGAGAAGGGGGVSGSGIVIHLNQTFNLEGAGKEVKTQIQEATQLTMREFERLMERYTHNKNRRGYA